MRLILISLFLWATSLSAQKIQDTLKLPAIHTVEKGEHAFRLSPVVREAVTEARTPRVALAPREWLSILLVVGHFNWLFVIMVGIAEGTPVRPGVH
jgi:hypothetical protein